MSVRWYNKLVRDGVIPELLAKRVRFEIRHLAADEEYVDALVTKLGEETDEFKEARTADELADVQEVLAALVSEMFPNGEVARARCRKRESRGAFADRVLLLWVEEERADDA